MARQASQSTHEEKSEPAEKKTTPPAVHKEEISSKHDEKEKPSSRPGSAVGRAPSHVSKASTLVGSKAGGKETPRGSVVSTERKKEGSTVEHQAWKVKDSDSDVSITHRQSGNQKKN